MISYITLSMPLVLTLYYLLTPLVHPYPLPFNPFISLNMFYTVHSLLQICLFFSILNYFVVATLGSATMHCHCFLCVTNEA